MTQIPRWRISITLCGLLAMAACGWGQLSQSEALELIRKSGFFDKTQQGGLVLKVLEVPAIKNINKTTAEVQFLWVAGSSDAPELRFEIDSTLVFQRVESGWELDRAELGKLIQSAIEVRVDSTAAERYMKIISMAEGDFSARRGRYASLQEMTDADIIPKGLTQTESGFQIAGYFFKLEVSPEKFTVTSRSLVISESVPAYYADSSGGIRFSEKGPATVRSPLMK